MTDQCKMEFYFKASEMKALLKLHPKATGIIITQEIKGKYNATTKKCVSSFQISAKAVGTPEPKGKKQVMTASTKLMDQIGGCPYPPGCGEDEVNA